MVVPANLLLSIFFLLKSKLAIVVNIPAISSISYELAAPIVLIWLACLGPSGESAYIHNSEA